MKCDDRYQLIQRSGILLVNEPVVGLLGDLLKKLFNAFVLLFKRYPRFLRVADVCRSLQYC